MPRYDPKRIEPKWQAWWEQNRTFETPVMPGTAKLYVLDMFPYPSGDGLHVGHPEGYTATDITCRYARMQGKTVLHPMGWDAFGLPAEQHAIRTGTPPRETTYKNIATFRRQLKSLGFSYDWSRELATTDPEYFRWTQWIFLQLFDTWYDPEWEWVDASGKTRRAKGRPIADLPIPAEVKAQGAESVRRFQDAHRLAYQNEAPVNWCPALGTVLANEEVIDGQSERGGHPVVRLPLRQWMLRITAYAERLLDDLDQVAWPESIKQLQRNWIGKSDGAEVDFWIGTDDDDVDPETAAAEFEDWKASRAEAGFLREPGPEVIRIYTTRPDTLFGATYLVLAPEHPFIDRLTTVEQLEAVDDYRRRATLKSDLDRTDLAKDKTGVFTGSYAINPVNGEPIPVWIADYVLGSYGTGAIMAVPAHDERDFEFATKFSLPIRPVVMPPKAWLSGHVPTGMPVPDKDPGQLQQVYLEQPTRFDCFADAGEAVNSGPYDGLATAEFKTLITTDLVADGLGRGAINYRLRDWLFSRQHFWGEPFPIWHELDASGKSTGLMRTVAEADLPVTLPDMPHFKPHGRPEPPLAEAPAEWLNKTDADGTKLFRETNTMPQWAGSCWYYLRFIDPKNSTTFIDPAKERAWMPVDLYIGGAEHAVLHLLYSRFWHKVLFDRGHVSMEEPFRRLVNQGMILGEAELTGYVVAEGEAESGKRKADETAPVWVSARDVIDGPDADSPKIHMQTRQQVSAVKVTPEQVGKKGNDYILADRPEIIVESRSFKMSKSRGNVINPDVVVDEYGADSLRLYEMFMGPLEATKPWSTSGVEGVSRFLARVWRMLTNEAADDVRLSAAVDDAAPTPEQLRLLHKTIEAVTRDIENLSFNTAISRMMEFVNAVSTHDIRPRAIVEPFVLLLSPFAPHLAEELWQLLGHDGTLASVPWPKHDPQILVESEIEIPVQVNGKLRGKVTIAAGSDQAAALAAAHAEPRIADQLAGKQIVKVIYVADRLLNLVVK
ncbi:MAG: leucine--tRNA ligase [Planctomycetaceae bacterium]|nr:leucine--tRNA ligase [Planctomycetaceae bacterium]